MMKIKTIRTINKEESLKINSLPKYKKKMTLAGFVSFLFLSLGYLPFILILIFSFMQYSIITWQFKVCIIITTILIYLAFVITDLLFNYIIKCYFEEEKKKNPEMNDSEIYQFHFKYLLIDDLTNPFNIILPIIFSAFLVAILSLI